MKATRRIGKFALAICAACPSMSNAGTFTTLYTFTGKQDAGSPYGGMVYRNGALYGTAAGYLANPPSKGIVFKIDVGTGALQVIYNFQGGNDGSEPDDLIYQNGMFYGTTVGGGGTQCNGSGCGTVFALDAQTGTETVLYAFPDPHTGLNAGADGLIAHDDTIYGTTYDGGSYGYGSVFAINLQTRAETDLYSFTNAADGIWPGATLLYKDGLVYGITTSGNKTCSNEICGTVFSVNPATGTESTLHIFAPGAGGYRPYSNLVDHKGLIYGGTAYGGDLSCGKGGCGTIFSVDPSTAVYNVVETLTTNHQRVPGLLARGDELFETVQAPNGRRTNHINQGQLAEFSLKTGNRTVLYKFDQGINGASGAQPQAPLVYANGVFYGSTTSGGGTGCNNRGCGTLFKYVP